MSYNVSTFLIWDFFDGGESCPTCKIRQKIENDLADTYLSHAVMVEEERGLVNKLGFCEKHFKQLYSGNNKLGLSLQQNSRIDYILNKVKTPNPKTAKKQAEKFENLTTSCVMCKNVLNNMERYYETIVKLYRNEKQFREVNFKTSKRFCAHCYTSLLKYSPNAKKYFNEFILDLNSIFKNGLTEVNESLKEFNNSFDYHFKGTPSARAKNSLQNCYTVLYSEAPLTPTRK